MIIKFKQTSRLSLLHGNKTYHSSVYMNISSFNRSFFSFATNFKRRHSTKLFLRKNVENTAFTPTTRTSVILDQLWWTSLILKSKVYNLWPCFFNFLEKLDICAKTILQKILFFKTIFSKKKLFQKLKKAGSLIKSFKTRPCLLKSINNYSCSRRLLKPS